ncbi:MAG: hypothetical protein RBS86_04705 [Candidatus Moranbacteria bacterium]|jgi:hypothetical protein|nr:hypothetical protein [Candidatus Moranbacteria bacterium]
MEKNQKNNSGKEISMTDLAAIMQAGFESSNKKSAELEKAMQVGFERLSKETDEKIEDLARVIQGSLLESEERLSKQIKGSTEWLQAEINKKVEKTDHNTLIYRVEKLEKLSKKFA